MVIIVSLKLTKQRQEILDLIQTSSGHMTADQIHSELKDNNVKIGIATVYRNLNVLFDKHLINRVRHPELGYIYDKNVDEHYHFRCVECDRIEDVSIAQQNQLHNIVEKELGCIVKSHDINFEGVCRECLKKQSS